MTIDDTVEDFQNAEQDEGILLRGDLGRHARIWSSAHQQEVVLSEKTFESYREGSTLRRKDHAEVVAMTSEVALGGDLHGIHFLDEKGKGVKHRDGYGENKPLYVES